MKGKEYEDGFVPVFNTPFDEEKEAERKEEKKEEVKKCLV